jgi:hypothetical protein
VEFNELRAKGFYFPELLEGINLNDKRCHLWLHGPKNSGKTYFIEKLMEAGVRLYQGPYNNDWTGFD